MHNSAKWLLMVFIFSLGLMGNQGLLKEVRKSINGHKPFKVDFIQQILNEKTVELEESGDIIFKNPETVKWVYRVPEFKIFLLIGEDFQLYDKDYEQLTIGTINTNQKEVIWQILFSEKMNAHIRCDEKHRKIFVKQKEKDLDIEIELNEKFLPKKVIHNDPSGYIRVFYFKNYKPKTKLGPNEFKLNVPKDVEIVNID